MFFREFEALTANTLFLPLSWLDHIYWKHIHTCTHSALRLLAIISDFASLCPSTHSLCPRIWIWQTKGNVFLYIWHICSQQFPALLFIYFPSLYPISYSWMRQCRHYPFFFSCCIHEFTGSQSFFGENSRVMDRNGGRHCTVLTYWKCKISYIHFCRWLPNYTLAVRVTCHLTAAVILSVQQRGPIAILLFHFTTMQIICSCTTPPALNSGWIILHIRILWMRAGISKSINITERDI